jgi:hypothetical protein
MINFPGMEKKKPKIRPDFFDVKEQCEQACLEASEACEQNITQDALQACRGQFLQCALQCHYLD